MEVTTLPKALVQRVLQGLAKGAGELHVRFDEREVETEQGRAREAPPRHTKEPDG